MPQLSASLTRPLRSALSALAAIFSRLGTAAAWPRRREDRAVWAAAAAAGGAAAPAAAALLAPSGTRAGREARRTRSARGAGAAEVRPGDAGVGDRDRAGHAVEADRVRLGVAAQRIEPYGLFWKGVAFTGPPGPPVAGPMTSIAGIAPGGRSRSGSGPRRSASRSSPAGRRTTLGRAVGAACTCAVAATVCVPSAVLVPRASPSVQRIRLAGVISGVPPRQPRASRPCPRPAARARGVPVRT